MFVQNSRFSGYAEGARSRWRFDFGAVWRAYNGGWDFSPRSRSSAPVAVRTASLGIGADPGHHEHRSPVRRREFQILTPQAIASVRGTRWAMDVTGMQTSTLVLSGEVAVARKNEGENVLVGPGQGVDVEIPPGGASRSLSPYQPDPMTVKQWGPARVKELLDRSGR